MTQNDNALHLPPQSNFIAETTLKIVKLSYKFAQKGHAILKRANTKYHTTPMLSALALYLESHIQILT
jgi:hypothetical protein